MDTGSALTTGDLARLRSDLSSMAAASDDSERIDRIRVLEELKSAVAAAQVVETAAFAASQRAAQRTAGVPESRVGRGIAAQVALARRESPDRAQRYTGWATILTTELPATFAALRAGQVTEWRAMIVARETAWLSRANRLRVDAELAPQLHALGDRRVEAAAKRISYRLDPHGYTDRLRAAENDRRVTLRPAPDAMTRLSALLPVAHGVAAYAALTRAADTTIATGDTDTINAAETTAPRSRGQIMADTLVQRLTGQAHAPDVPVEITLVMTDTALLGEPGTAEREEPATVVGYGPVPATWARHLITQPADHTPMWIRRLYRHPATGELAQLESRRRLFTANQRLFLRIRDDDTCRTPWCDAPARHADHITAAQHDGPTSTTNGQSLCQACNHTKQAPGWTARPTTGDTIELTTPTGHTYTHAPPDPPGQQSRAAPDLPLPNAPLPRGVTFVRPDRHILVEIARHPSAA